MATNLLSPVDLDAISTQAHEVRPGRTLLTILTAVFFGLGWVVARVFGVLWLSLAWTFVAFREGWREGQKATRSRRR
jgi:hypothetical protein